jgi:hypothetical protein
MNHLKAAAYAQKLKGASSVKMLCHGLANLTKAIIMLKILERHMKAYFRIRQKHYIF